MRRAVLFGLFVAASAMAQDTEEAIRARAPAATDLQICRSMMYGPQPYQRIASQEQYRRGLDCGRYVPAITAERQALVQAAPVPNAPVQVPKLEPLVPVQAQPTVTCTTQAVLGQLQTTCR